MATTIVLVEVHEIGVQPLLDSALHVHEAVAFPMQIGELGDDVAGDLRLQAHARDLVGEAAGHVFLAGGDEVLEAAEDTV